MVEDFVLLKRMASNLRTSSAFLYPITINPLKIACYLSNSCGLMRKILDSVMKIPSLLCIGLATFGVVGCSFMQPQQEAPLAVIPARQIETQKITLGSVQSRVQVGAYSGDVIDALGSPNQVTSNSDGGETWVYDKLTTEEEYAKGKNSGVNVKSSRTLIVVVKFDKKKRVKDVQYRQTSY